MKFFVFVQHPNKSLIIKHYYYKTRIRKDIKFKCILLSRRMMHATFHKLMQLFNFNRICFYFIFMFSSFMCSADLLMIFLPDECKRTILPRGIKTIRFENTPSTLYEYSLRGLYRNRQYYNAICGHLTSDCLPLSIFKSVRNGPICMCGNEACNVPLFTECHFSLMKK